MIRLSLSIFTPPTPQLPEGWERDSGNPHNLGHEFHIVVKRSSSSQENGGGSLRCLSVSQLSYLLQNRRHQWVPRVAKKEKRKKVSRGRQEANVAPLWFRCFLLSPPNDCVPTIACLCINMVNKRTSPVMDI